MANWINRTYVPVEYQNKKKRLEFIYNNAKITWKQLYNLKSDQQWAIWYKLWGKR